MTPIVVLCDEDAAYATSIGAERAISGNPSPNDNPDSGKGNVRVHTVGAFAEVAVCRFYGEDPYYWVETYEERPGATADLCHANLRVSVKASEFWGTAAKPPFLIVPHHDIHNSIYVLVSVDLEHHRCGMRGWVPRNELLRYAPEPWRDWKSGAPGLARSGKLRRYVPLEDLRPCHAPRATFQEPDSTLSTVARA